MHLYTKFVTTHLLTVVFTFSDTIMPSTFNNFKKTENNNFFLSNHSYLKTHLSIVRRFPHSLTHTQMALHLLLCSIRRPSQQERQICQLVCASAPPRTSLLQPFAQVAWQTLWNGSSPKPHWSNLPVIGQAKAYLLPVNIIYLPVLSDCLSLHVDACQIE